MGMGSGGGRGEVTSDINVTPMADVMLVLLIIFMVVTPMLQKGKDVELARTKNPIDMKEADRDDAIIVTIGIVARGFDSFFAESPPPLKINRGTLPELASVARFGCVVAPKNSPACADGMPVKSIRSLKTGKVEGR